MLDNTGTSSDEDDSSNTTSSMTRIDMSPLPLHPTEDEGTLHSYRIRQQHLIQDPERYPYYSQAKAVFPPGEHFGHDNIKIGKDTWTYSYSLPYTYVTRDHEVWWPHNDVDPSTCPRVWSDGPYKDMWPESHYLKVEDIGSMVGLYLCPRVILQALDKHDFHKQLVKQMRMEEEEHKGMGKKVFGELQAQGLDEPDLRKLILWHAVCDTYAKDGALSRDPDAIFDIYTAEIRFRDHLLRAALHPRPLMSTTPNFAKAWNLAKGFAEKGYKNIRIVAIVVDGLPKDTLIWNAEDVARTYRIGHESYFKDEWLLLTTTILPEAMTEIRPHWCLKTLRPKGSTTFDDPEPTNDAESMGATPGSRAPRARTGFLLKTSSRWAHGWRLFVPSRGHDYKYPIDLLGQREKYNQRYKKKAELLSVRRKAARLVLKRKLQRQENGEPHAEPDENFDADMDDVLFISDRRGHQPHVKHDPVTSSPPLKGLTAFSVKGIKLEDAQSLDGSRQTHALLESASEVARRKQRKRIKQERWRSESPKLDIVVKQE